MVKLAVPGLMPDSFEISVQQHELTIRDRTQVEEQANGRYHVREQRFGEFTPVIQFPTAVDADKILATLADSILTIHVPKAGCEAPADHGQNRLMEDAFGHDLLRAVCSTRHMT